MKSIKIGDRVQIIDDYDDAEKGWKGTVLVMNTHPEYDNLYGIRFDDYFESGHDLNGKVNCPDGFGHWVSKECIRLIKKQTPKTKKRFKLTIEK